MIWPRMWVKSETIVWIRGPFTCSVWHIVKNFKNCLEQDLLPNELVVANNGNSNVHWINTAIVRAECSMVRAQVLVRHETCNCRLWILGILNLTFRHNINTHCVVVIAASRLTVLMMLAEEPFFSLWTSRSVARKDGTCQVAHRWIQWTYNTV